jgi:hypothetical protein
MMFSDSIQLSRLSLRLSFLCSSAILSLNVFDLKMFANLKCLHSLEKKVTGLRNDCYLMKLGNGLNAMSAAVLTLVTAVYVSPLANSVSERFIMIFPSVMPANFAI